MVARPDTRSPVRSLTVTAVGCLTVLWGIGHAAAGAGVVLDAVSGPPAPGWEWLNRLFVVLTAVGGLGFMLLGLLGVTAEVGIVCRRRTVRFAGTGVGVGRGGPSV